jgi:hypothetical protein
MAHRHPTDHTVAAQWRCCCSPPAPSVSHHHSDWGSPDTISPIKRPVNTSVSPLCRVTITDEALRMVDLISTMAIGDRASHLAPIYRSLHPSSPTAILHTSNSSSANNQHTRTLVVGSLFALMMNSNDSVAGAQRNG